MSGRASLNVSLTPELGRFVQDRVSTGRYQTASEVVREGLRLLEQREQQNQLAIEQLKARLARSSAQADHGKLVDPDHTLKKIAALKSKRAAKKA